MATRQETRIQPMHQEIAKIERTHLGYEDHGILTAMLHCTFGSSGQGIGGYSLDEYDETLKCRVGTAAGMDWIIGVLKACGVRSWEDVRGRTILVLRKNDSWGAEVLGIAPLPTERGKPFLFADWKAKHFPDLESAA